jgi:hypothetical protein
VGFCSSGIAGVTLCSCVNSLVSSLPESTVPVAGGEDIDMMRLLTLEIGDAYVHWKAWVKFRRAEPEQVGLDRTKFRPRTTSSVAQGSESWQRKIPTYINLLCWNFLACVFKSNNLLRANQRSPKSSQAHTVAKRTLNPCNNPNRINHGKSRFIHCTFLILKFPMRNSSRVYT